MDRAIQIIKAFHGDVFGVHVRETLFGKNDSVNTIPIDARVDENVFYYLLNILGIFYRIEITKLKPKQVTIVLTAAPRDLTQRITVNITRCHHLKWHEIPQDFDVNMLVNNGTAIFVRPYAFLNFNMRPNIIDLIRDRIASKVFSIIATPPFPLANVKDLICKSHAMVASGWCMDDIYCQKNTWLINRWADYKRRARELRTSHTSSDINLMLGQEQCCLCHDRFRDDSIVFNTCCNHNFHWQCNEENLTGIMTWFSAKNDFDCPYCRQRAVQFVA